MNRLVAALTGAVALAIALPAQAVEPFYSKTLDKGWLCGCSYRVDAPHNPTDAAVSALEREWHPLRHTPLFCRPTPLVWA